MLDKSECITSNTARFTPGMWIGFRIGIGSVKKRKISSFADIHISNRPAPSVVTIPTALSRLIENEKIKVKVKASLKQVTKAQTGSRDIALLFLQPRR